MIAPLVLMAILLAQVPTPTPTPTATATPNPAFATPDFVIYGTTTGFAYFPFQVTFRHLFSDPRPVANVVFQGSTRNAYLPTTETQALIAAEKGTNGGAAINEFYSPSCPAHRVYLLKITTSITGNGGGNIDCYTSPQLKAYAAAVMAIVNDLGLVKKHLEFTTIPNGRFIPSASPSPSPVPKPKPTASILRQ